jgi:hypothetical protein
MLIKIDDYTIDSDGQFWTQLCSEHLQIVPVEQLSDGASNPVCGVLGCNKCCDHYWDFNQHQTILIGGACPTP